MLSTGNNLLRRNRQLTSALKKATVSTTCIHHTSITAHGKSDIHNVTVIGGGVMGAGIAQASAQNGHSVTVVDTDEFTQKCMVSIMKSLNLLAKKKFVDEPKSSKKFIDDVMGNIKTTQSMTKGCEHADLVIESVVENLKVKKQLLKRADEVAPASTIFASNTSSLLIEDIAVGTGRLDRFAGLHFFNPVWKMKLVEVIGIEQTSDNTMKQVTSYINGIGKVPVRCNDNHGFIVNNLLYPYLLDAIRFYERGHGSIEDIDIAMKLGAGLPSGPFELIDIIGLDTVNYVCSLWHEKYPDDPKYFPIDTLTEMVQKKKLGRKTGQGFYKYKHKLY